MKNANPPLPCGNPTPLPLGPVPSDVLRYVQDKAPWFSAATKAAAASATTGAGTNASTRRTRRQTVALPPVALTLGAFGEDMALLYACLWHAHDQGVPVLFEAPPREAPPRN